MVFTNLFDFRSHSLTVPSILPEAIIRESGEMSKQVTYSVCPLKVVRHVFILGSHTLTLVSIDPDTNSLLFQDRVAQFER